MQAVDKAYRWRSITPCRRGPDFGRQLLACRLAQHFLPLSFLVVAQKCSQLLVRLLEEFGPDLRVVTDGTEFLTQST